MKFATLKPNFLVAFPVFHHITRIGVPLNFATFRPSREFSYTQNECSAVVLRRFKIMFMLKHSAMWKWFARHAY